jgi:branched-chain amino acid transport system permease protein
LFGALLLTLLPTVFQPLAIYKTFASGGLLVASFLYLPQGLYGAIVQLAIRFVRSPRKTVSSKIASNKTASKEAASETSMRAL